MSTAGPYLARASPTYLAAAGALIAAALAGFAVGRAGGGSAWPSYAPVFDRVAAGVVNVSVDGASVRLGSGFAVGPDEVVTARHLVIDAASHVLIRDLDGRTLPAAVVGVDARTDLALLSVPGAHFQPNALGATDGLRIGDPVFAIGNPYGLGHSLSVGVVGGRGRRLQVAQGDDVPRVDFLQMSIPLNPGNSGGPVFDAGGRVVGVLSGTHAQGQAIAFVVPVETLRDSLPALRAGQRVSRAFIGFELQATESGPVVSRLIPSSPGDRAGIREGDQLVSIDGQRLGSPTDLARVLDPLRGGSTVEVEVVRAGAQVRFSVELADWAEQPVVIAGMILRPALGAGGEVAAVTPRSRAERAGVRAGDVVRAVDGVPVRAPADVRDALLGGTSAQLDLVRGGVPVGVQLGAVAE
jgi:serine protease Do